MAKQGISQLPYTQLALALIIGIIAVRLFSLGMYPLFDTTEARYGEIARIMYETNNWVTPMFDYNVPFWGKPPAHTWLSASSMFFFGVNEFTARLPHLLTGIGCLLLVFYFARRVIDPLYALKATLILVSMLGFTICAGMVMTDTALTFTLLISAYAFWLCLFDGRNPCYGHLFFAGLGLCMLIKGPVALVIAGIALGLFATLTGNWKTLFQKLPWFTGTLVFLMICLPWYLLAEWATPGFLEYFLWGEHVQRFLVPGWEGDLYGTAHKEPKGTIWLFWLLMALPWSLILLYKVGKHSITHGVKNSIESVKHTSELQVYFLCWAVAPMLLFTLAGNVLSAYVLPGLPALALALANMRISLRFSIITAGLSFIVISVALALLNQGVIGKTNEKGLMQSVQQSGLDLPILYWKKRPFSAQFYSYGLAFKVENAQQIEKYTQTTNAYWLVVSHDDIKQNVPVFSSYCEEHDRNKKRLLLLCNSE